MRNRRPGACATCSETVGTGEGVYSWYVTYHDACFGRTFQPASFLPRRPGKCDRCDDPVPAGGGLLGKLGGRWSVLCPVCVPAVGLSFSPMKEEETAPIVSFEADGRPTGCPVATWDVLRPYQREGVRCLAAKRRWLLRDEMGLGKTVQVLAALSPRSRVVVCCPAVAKGVWARETKRWQPSYEATILQGRGSFRWPDESEVVVLNYELLPQATGGRGERKVSTAPAPPGDVVLVFDEAHYLKSTSSQRTANARGLAKLCARVWLLTGTPMQNHPLELRSVLDAAGLSREALGDFDETVRLFRGRKGRWGGWTWGTPCESVPDRLARVSLGRRRLDVLRELPPKTYQTIPVSLDDETRELCDGVMTKLAELGVDLERVRDLAELSRGGVPFEALSKARAALATAKLAAAVELVEEHEEAGEPLVFASYHRVPVETIGSREGWGAILGTTPAHKRTELVDAFQRGDLRGLAVTIQAGGVALTLTRAHRMLRLDRAWVPATNEQVEDRICRIGQDRGCVYLDLVADHRIDERVEELLAEKRSLVDGAGLYDATPEQETPEPKTPQDATSTPSRKERCPCGSMCNLCTNPTSTYRPWTSSERRASEEASRPLTWDVTRDPGPGTFTVDLGSSHVTLHFSEEGRVSRLVGPDNTRDYRRIGTLVERQLLLFQRPGDELAAALRVLFAPEGDLGRFREAYAMRSGRCALCGRKLTVPASLHAGLGPICSGRLLG